jgi:hypothetical protein
MSALVANPRFPRAARAVRRCILNKPPSLARCLFDWLTSWRLRRGVLYMGAGLYMVASQIRPGPWLVWGYMIDVVTNVVNSFARDHPWLALYAATEIMLGILLPSVLIWWGARLLEGPDLRLIERHMYRMLRRERRRGHVIEVHRLVFDGMRAELSGPESLAGKDGGPSERELRELAGLYFHMVAGYGFLARHLLATPDEVTREALEQALLLVGRNVVILERAVMAVASQWAQEDEVMRQELMRADAACVPRLS